MSRSTDVSTTSDTVMSDIDIVVTQPDITPTSQHRSLPPPPDHTHNYKGEGTHDNPYIVEYGVNEDANPINWPESTRMMITLVISLSCVVVTFNSSEYAGAITDITEYYKITSVPIQALGTSLFVLGFALGALCWGSLSEMYGRRAIFFVTYTPFIVWLAADAGANDVMSLLWFRLLAGAFGSSVLVVAPGVIGDMYITRNRGKPISIAIAAVFCGPVTAPAVGGFVSETVGWRWALSVQAFFALVAFLLVAFLVPETYAPVLLRRHAAELMKQQPGVVYKTKQQIDEGGEVSVLQKLHVAVTRPWRLLFLEPIVLLMSIWISVVYGTLYLFFTAFPIVFQHERGWSPGIGGLALFGVGVGMALAMVANIFYFDRRYIAITDDNTAHRRSTPPEQRLPMACVGAVLCPVALIAFAWTTYPSVHWAAPVILSAPFGSGMILIFLAIQSYLIDVYLLYAASALAANSLMRSLFAFAFPLFAPYMYNGVGTQWASTIVAAMSLLCMPIPFMFMRYGAQIRSWSNYAALSKSESKLEKDAIVMVERETEAEAEKDGVVHCSNACEPDKEAERANSFATVDKTV